jgi:hypothetical protein
MNAHHVTFLLFELSKVIRFPAEGFRFVSEFPTENRDLD